MIQLNASKEKDLMYDMLSAVPINENRALAWEVE